MARPGRTKAKERITMAGRLSRKGLTNEREALGSDRSTHVNPGAIGYTCNHTTAEAETGGPQDLTGSQPSYMGEL